MEGIEKSATANSEIENERSVLSPVPETIINRLEKEKLRAPFNSDLLLV